MGFDDNKEGGETSCEKKHGRENQDEGEKMGTQPSDLDHHHASTDHEEEDDDQGSKLQLGPQYTLKEQLEKDKVCVLMVKSII